MLRMSKINPNMTMDDEIIGTKDKWWFWNPLTKKKVGPFKSKTEAVLYLKLQFRDLVGQYQELQARYEELYRVNSILEKALSKK